MKIRAETSAVRAAVEIRTAKVTTDIEQAEQRVRELEPEAERSESTKKAVAAIRSAIDRARKVRDQLATIDRALRGVDDAAEVELNDNECTVLSFVDVR